VVLYHITQGRALSLGYQLSAKVIAGSYISTGFLVVFVDVEGGYSSLCLFDPVAVAVPESSSGQAPIKLAPPLTVRSLNHGSIVYIT
jgi:hypothetical protein